jgi:hypothetical protein
MLRPYKNRPPVALQSALTVGAGPRGPLRRPHVYAITSALLTGHFHLRARYGHTHQGGHGGLPLRNTPEYMRVLAIGAPGRHPS